jgi:thymidine phosphorylase
VQAAAGILCLAKPGEAVTEGEPLLELHTDTPEAVPAALAALEGSFAVASAASAPEPIVRETIRGTV